MSIHPTLEKCGKGVWYFCFCCQINTVLLFKLFEPTQQISVYSIFAAIYWRCLVVNIRQIFTRWSKDRIQHDQCYSCGWPGKRTSRVSVSSGAVSQWCWAWPSWKRKTNVICTNVQVIRYHLTITLHFYLHTQFVTSGVFA